MTIEKTHSKDFFFGNSASRVFPLSFPVPEAPIGERYLFLEISDEDGSNAEEVTANYSLSRDGLSVTVHYPLAGEPLPQGKKLTAFRKLPLKQLTDLENNDDYDAETVEGTFDRDMMIFQQMQEELDRSVKVPVSDSNPPKNAEDFYADIDDLIEKGKGEVQGLVDEAQGYADEARRQADRAAELVDAEAIASQVYNIRRAWLAVDDVAAGEILQLQGPYYPLRDVLSLRIGSIECTPKHALVDASGKYQYEEIGDDPNELSYQVRVWFDVKAGDLVDMHVIASGVSLQEFEALVAEAHAASDAAAQAQTAAERAATEAMAAARTLPSLETAQEGQTIVARMVDGALVWVSEFSSGTADWQVLRVTLDTDFAAGGTLPVPQYISGSHKIQVYLGGVLCDPGTSGANGFYGHIGSSGEQAAAITIFEALPAGKKIAVVVAA